MAWLLLDVIPFHRLLRVEVTSPCFLATVATQGVSKDFNSVIAASIAAQMMELHDDKAIC